MSLKKNFVNHKGQSIVEYTLIFTIFALAVVFVFGALNPDHLSIKSVISNALDAGIARMSN
jgi:Flp pilus assembly pilin Flp